MSYQQAKVMLFEHLQKKGYTIWVKKPEEQDQFTTSTLERLHLIDWIAPAHNVVRTLHLQLHTRMCNNQVFLITAVHVLQFSALQQCVHSLNPIYI